MLATAEKDSEHAAVGSWRRARSPAPTLPPTLELGSRPRHTPIHSTHLALSPPGPDDNP